jgi:hypothetical protein
MTLKADIDHAVEFYLDEVDYLVTLDDYSDEDKAEMRARQARLRGYIHDFVNAPGAHYIDGDGAEWIVGENGNDKEVLA